MEIQPIPKGQWPLSLLIVKIHLIMVAHSLETPKLINRNHILTRLPGEQRTSQRINEPTNEPTNQPSHHPHTATWLPALFAMPAPSTQPLFSELASFLGRAGPEPYGEPDSSPGRAGPKQWQISGQIECSNECQIYRLECQIECKIEFQNICQTVTFCLNGDNSGTGQRLRWSYSGGNSGLSCLCTNGVPSAPHWWLETCIDASRKRTMRGADGWSVQELLVALPIIASYFPSRWTVQEAGTTFDLGACAAQEDRQRVPGLANDSAHHHCWYLAQDLESRVCGATHATF